MEVKILQIILVGVTFLVTMICLLLPLKVFPRDSGKELGPKSQRILSLSNCVSGGVFLGVCFIGLIPIVREKFLASLSMADIDILYPVTELVVLLGFFLVLFTEQSIRAYKKRQKNHHEMEEMIKYPNEYFLCSEDDSTGSDDSEAEAERRAKMTGSTTSSIPLLMDVPVTQNGASSARAATTSPKKPQRKRIPGRHRINRSRNASQESLDPHHGHGDGGHGGHGHSHSVDLADGFTLRAGIMLLALSIHSLFEGMAVGLQDNMGKLVNLFISVLAHECLVCFAVGISLAKQKTRMATLVKLAILFCSMIPVGMIIGILIGGIHNFAGTLSSAIIQAIAAGTFIYVIFMESLPTEFNDKQDPILKVCFVFIGFLLMACLRVVSG